MVTGYRASIRRKDQLPFWHEKRCKRCGKLFLGRGDDWASPHYCSARCASAARNERRRQQPSMSVCAVCGERFEHRRVTARYCSTRCRVAAHRKR